MRVFTIALLSLFLTLSGCATTSCIKLTPLEIQSIQTREYEQNKNIVFPSVLSVFQDLSYIIKSADIETGLITAEGIASSNFASQFWLGIAIVSQTNATAFIEEIGKITKVRLNFVTSQTTSAVYGQTDRQDQPILDAKIYNNAFERIENAIFVRNSN